MYLQSYREKLYFHIFTNTRDFFLIFYIRNLVFFFQMQSLGDQWDLSTKLKVY